MSPTSLNQMTLNRRRFLARSASAIMAAPFIGRSVFGQDSPNSKLGAMVVGIGDRGGAHIEAMLADPRTELLYLCDPRTDRVAEIAQKIKEKQGFAPKVIRDLREGLGDEKLDLVTCAAVSHWHALCGIWSLQAGKHVFIEKPVCSSINEGKTLIAAARKYGRVCQVGTQRRTHKGMIDAVEFVQNGGIGEVKLARGICYKRRRSIGSLDHYPIPSNVDYNLWCGPCPDGPLTRPIFHYDWHWQRRYGNGEIGNNGPHFNDMSRWFLGLERFPQSVFSYGGRVGYHVERKDVNYIDAGDTPNTHVSVFDFGDKTIVMECRGLETPKLLGINFGTIVYGSEGYLTAEETTATAYDPSGKVIKQFSGGGRQFGEFIDAVEKNDPSLVKADVRCGYLSAALCHLGEIAYYTGEQNKMPTNEMAKFFADKPEHHLTTFSDTIEHLKKNGVDPNRTMLSISKPLEISTKNEETLDESAQKLFARTCREGFIVPEPDKV